MTSINLVLVEPCQLLREGLERILNDFKITILASTATVGSALQALCSAGPPDVMLHGVAEGAEPGQWLGDIDTARGSFSDLRTILLATTIPEQPLVRHAIESRVDALMSKNISGEVLLRSIQLVMLGQQLYPPQALGPDDAGAAPAYPAMSNDLAVPDTLPGQAERLPRVQPGERTALSNREDQVLRSLVVGCTNKSIAHDLGISEATVKVHIRALLRKVGAANRTQAAIWGMNRSVAVNGQAGLSQKV